MAVVVLTPCLGRDGGTGDSVTKQQVKQEVMFFVPISF